MQLRSITLHTGSQIIGKAISLLVGLSITAIITKQLPDKETYGQYLLLINLVLQLISISEWGTGFIAVRAASQKKFPSHEIFSTLLLFRMATGLIAITTLMIAGLCGLYSIPFTTYVLAACLILPTTIKNVTQSIFQTRFQYTTFATLETSINVLYLLGLIYLRPLNFLTLNQALILLSAAITIIALVAVFLTRHSLRPLIFRFQILTYLLKESLPMGTQLLLFNLYNRMDIYFLEKFHGTIQVAYYGLAYKLFENLVQPAAFLMNTLYPHLSSQNQESFKNTFKLSSLVLLFIGLIGMLITIPLSPFIIQLINPQYQSSILLLQILSLTLPWTYINHLLGFSCIATGKQTQWMKIAAIAFCFNLIANLALLPRFGATAAAFVTLITEASITILAFKYLSPDLQITLQDCTPQNLRYQVRKLLHSW